MPDGSELWVWQHIYEPTQSQDGWVVHYKQNDTWQQKTFPVHEKAYDFYWAKYKELKTFYNIFLRELRVK